MLFLLSAAPRALAQAPDLSIPWARIVLGLLFCIGLAFIAVMVIRQRQGLPISLADLRQAFATGQPRPDSGALQIEQRIRLTAASQIVVLRCAERRYLVHLGNQGAQLIDRLPDPDVTLEQV